MLSRQILRAIPKCAPVSARAAHTDKEFANLDYYRTQEWERTILSSFGFRIVDIEESLAYYSLVLK